MDSDATIERRAGWAYRQSAVSWLTEGFRQEAAPNAPYVTEDWGPSQEKALRSLKVLGAVGALMAAPALYAMSLMAKTRKAPISDKERLLGETLEHTAERTRSLVLTGIAAPAVMVPLAYWVIEIMENYPPQRHYYNGWGTEYLTTPQGLFSGAFGDSLQTILAASMAAPVISGIASLVGAFRKGPK